MVKTTIDQLKKEGNVCKKMLLRVKRLNMADVIDEYAKTYKRIRNRCVRHQKNIKRKRDNGSLKQKAIEILGELLTES